MSDELSTQDSGQDETGEGFAETGSDADSFEGSSDDLDAASIAAEFDAAAITGAKVKTESDSPGKEEGKKANGDARDTGRSSSKSKLQEFIDKNYNGDEEAFLHSQYTSRDEARRLSDRVRDLEDRISKAPKLDTAAEWKNLRDSDPEVQALDQEIRASDQELQRISKRQYDISERAGIVNTEIAKLTGQLSKADDAKEYAQIAGQIAELRAELISLGDRFESNEDKKARVEKDKRAAKRELTRTEKALRESLDSEAADKESVAEANERDRQTFERAFEHIATQFYNLKKGSERYSYYNHATRTLLHDWLIENERKGGRPLDAQGIWDATAALLERGAKANGMVKAKTRSSGTSTSNSPASTQSATFRRVIEIPKHDRVAKNSSRGEGPTTGSKTLDEKFEDPEWLLRRSDAIAAMESRSRSRAKG